MRPVLKDLLSGNQLIEQGASVAGVAIPQGMVMGALNDRDGIDLDIPKMFNG